MIHFHCPVCRKDVKGMVNRTGFVCKECERAFRERKEDADGDIDDLLESRDDLEEVLDRLIDDSQ